VGFAALAIAMAMLLLSLTPVKTTTSESLQLVGSDPVGAVTGGLRMLLWMAARLLTTAHWLAVDLDQRAMPELILGAVVLLGLVLLVWRRPGAEGSWALWTMAYLAPFAMISEQLAIRRREEPSHYLYLASAGTSVLLALGLVALTRRLTRQGHVG
jgi:hypothetical protein|tara:strand:+ start:179 stop:646 length:468 start_codon:yes stop_codon:yes gene_type:complete